MSWSGPGGVDPDLPATTVAGDPRISGRHHHNTGEQGKSVPSSRVRAVYEGREAPDGDDRGGMKVTVEEAAVLQTFPADYPFQGNKGDRHRQIGDAIPPLMAYAIVEAVTTLDTREV